MLNVAVDRQDEAGAHFGWVYAFNGEGERETPRVVLELNQAGTPFQYLVVVAFHAIEAIADVSDNAQHVRKQIAIGIDPQRHGVTVDAVGFHIENGFPHLFGNKALELEPRFSGGELAVHFFRRQLQQLRQVISQLGQPLLRIGNQRGRYRDIPQDRVHGQELPVPVQNEPPGWRKRVGLAPL